MDKSQRDNQTNSLELTGYVASPIVSARRAVVIGDYPVSGDATALVMPSPARAAAAADGNLWRNVERSEWRPMLPLYR